MEQRNHGGPGDRGGMGATSGTPVLRGCGGGLLREAYSRASVGVKRNPARRSRHRVTPFELGDVVAFGKGTLRKGDVASGVSLLPGCMRRRSPGNPGRNPGRCQLRQVLPPEATGSGPPERAAGEHATHPRAWELGLREAVRCFRITLRMDLGPEHVQELGEPGGMCRPGRGSHQVAIHVGLVDADVHVLPAGARHVRPHGRVRRAAFPLENACRRQDLRSVTDGGEGLVRLGKVADDLQDILVQTNVLRRSATRNDQGVIGLGLYIGEGGVEGEVVTRLFAVGLIPLEVVHRRPNLFSRLLAGTHGVHRVPHHEEGLEWHHDLVVLDEIPHQHQDLLLGHLAPPLALLRQLQFKYFTAKRAKTAKAHPISEKSGDPTVQNFPDAPRSDFHFRGLEVPGVSLRALRPLRFKCNVWVQWTIHLSGGIHKKQVSASRPHMQSQYQEEVERLQGEDSPTAAVGGRGPARQWWPAGTPRGSGGRRSCGSRSGGAAPKGPRLATPNWARHPCPPGAPAGKP